MTVRLVFALATALFFYGAAPAQPKPALSPDGSEVLAEGPLGLSITLTEKGGTDGTGFKPVKEEGVLLFLTRNAIYYHEVKTGSRRIKTTKDVVKARLETLKPLTGPDGKARPVEWTFDAKTDAGFQGPLLPVREPRPAAPEGDAAKATNAFLYHALVRLQTRVDAALFVRDELQVAFYLKHAEELVAYVGRNGYSREVAAAYKGFDAYVKAQREASEDMETLVAEQAAARQELQRRAREAAAEFRAQQAAGQVNFFLSLLPSYEYVPIGGGLSVRVNTGPDLGDAIGALGGIYQARAAYQAEMQELLAAQQTLKKEAQVEYERIHALLTGGRKGRADLIRRIGAGQFGLKDPSPMDGLDDAMKGIDKKDKKAAAAALVRLFTEQAGYDRKAGPWDNPFALCDQYETEARVLPADDKRADKLFELAERAADAAKFVPADPAFAHERLEVLRVAARLACRAAAPLEGSWCIANSPRAAYAVRLIDQTADLAALDMTGEVREQRAVALLLVGRAADALAQARQVATLRKTSSAFHYTFARLLAAQCQHAIAPGMKPEVRKPYREEALASLQKAFRFGFSDLRELKAGLGNSDFSGLFIDAASKQELANLLRLEVTYSYLQVGDESFVVVTNKSAYPLTNLTGRLKPKGALPANVVELKLAPVTTNIRPDQEARFEVVMPPQPPKGFKFDFGNYTPVFTCDQVGGPFTPKSER